LKADSVQEDVFQFGGSIIEAGNRLRVLYAIQPTRRRMSPYHALSYKAVTVGLEAATGFYPIIAVIRWDEKAGLRRDAVGSQVIDALEAQEIKETGNEED
jgi:hypothetical protein